MPAKLKKPSTLGQNIKRLRQQRRMSQTQLALKAGMFSKVDVCRLETGVAQSVHIAKLERIAQALHVKMEALLKPYEPAETHQKQMEDLLS